MGERTNHAPGTPSWVDLGSPVPSESAEFYGQLFGWKTDIDPRPEAGGYGMFRRGDKVVAGLGPQQMPDAPPFWTVYVTVADADATAAEVRGRGGTVVVEPMDVFDAGRMAVFQDPSGAFFSIWQPDQHIGAQVVNEPGSFCWSELASPDLAVTRDFYASVFGWGTLEEGEGAHIYTVDGKVTCGAHAAGPGEPPAWTVWFAVGDCDASAQQAADLGGTVIMPPTDMSFGRGAVVADGHGAVFGIAALDQPDP
jgi:predicted enzyme related to lactoylglutathione lyase